MAINSFAPSATAGTAVATASSALAANFARLDQDAQAVATPGADPTAALLDARQTALAAQASLQVVRTSDAVLGTLLDIRA